MCYIFICHIFISFYLCVISSYGVDIKINLIKMKQNFLYRNKMFDTKSY